MNSDRIGSFRHRVIIEALQTAPDGGGGVTESWAEIDTVWAGISPRVGREIVQADRITGTLTHEIFIRYRADVRPAMRFRKGQRVFHIQACEDVDERSAILKCLCEERDL